MNFALLHLRNTNLMNYLVGAANRHCRLRLASPVQQTAGFFGTLQAPLFAEESSAA